MVEGSTAVGEDTTGVEGPVGSINGDGDGLLLESVQKIGGVTSGDINVSVKGVLGTGDLVTGSLGSSVGISGVGTEFPFLDVREGSVHHTTVATTVEDGAIDQLLFGEIDGVVSFTG